MVNMWKKFCKTKVIIGLVILCTAGYFGYQYYVEHNKSQPVFRTISVERGDLTATVSATGTITPVNLVNISSKITGLIKEVKVQENEKVTAGQTLIILDDRHLRALVEQSEAKLNNARANYNRISNLAAIGAVAPQQLDSARMEYNVAQAAYDDALSQLEDTVIKTPTDGIVIGKPIPAGQTVSPGISTPMVLMSVADMSIMQIETLIDESDIGKIQKGQKATFTVDAYPGKIFTGVVSSISNKAVNQQNVVYYTVIIDVDNPEGLKPTMTARVSVVVGESKSALLIPLSAVKEVKGKKIVTVMKNGVPEEVAIETGIMGEDKVEVISGLSDSDEIVVKMSKSQQNEVRQEQKTVRGVVGGRH